MAAQGWITSFLDQLESKHVISHSTQTAQCLAKLSIVPIKGPHCSSSHCSDGLEMKYGPPCSRRYFVVSFRLELLPAQLRAILRVQYI